MRTQGIVPIREKKASGLDPQRNLYWGSKTGIKGALILDPNWIYVKSQANPSLHILERCIFKRKDADVFIVADAWNGKKTKDTVHSFIHHVFSDEKQRIKVRVGEENYKLDIGPSASAVAFLGHHRNAPLAPESSPKMEIEKDVFLLSTSDFEPISSWLDHVGIKHLFLSRPMTGPHGKIIIAIVEGWMRGDSKNQLRMRAAVVHSKLNRCGIDVAKHDFGVKAEIDDEPVDLDKVSRSLEHIISPPN